MIQLKGCCPAWNIVDYNEVEELECPICYQVMIRPTQTPCGHNFGANCLAKWETKTKRKCPICRSKYQQTKQNIKLRYKTLELKGRCVHCEWTGKPQRLWNHIQDCEGVRRQYIEKLGQIVDKMIEISRIQMESHLQNHQAKKRKEGELMSIQRHWSQWWNLDDKTCEKCKQIRNTYECQLNYLNQIRISLLTQINQDAIRDIRLLFVENSL